jgi:Protein of unknown function (DUF3223)
MPGRAGTMKKVEISTRSFPTQKEAIAYFQAMLKRYESGERVNEEDARDLLSLIERHPEASMKIGVGINHLKVTKTLDGTNCFYIVREDSSGTDFSFYTCVRGKAPTRKQEVSEAFREAVKLDIWSKRDNFYKDHSREDGLLPCAKTKEWIRRDEGHIDHMPPMTFEVIVTTFLAHRGLNYDQVPISHGADNQTQAVLTDANLAQQFREYHKSVATLDFVKSSVNLAQASPNRIKKSRMN